MVSDLHLTGTVTTASTACTAELVEVLSNWDEPGVLVIAGDGFEQLHEPVAPIGDILDAHGSWTDAVRSFACRADHDVVVLSGNHDGNLAWDPEMVDAMVGRLGASHVALAADLVFDTEEGEKRVHVVHGNQDDPYNAFVDRRSPIDTPTGHHVVRQVLPLFDRVVRPGGLLDGLAWLSEPTLAVEMVASRLLYRRIGRRAWLLALPFVAALLLRLLTVLPDGPLEAESNLLAWLTTLGVALLGMLVLVAAVTALTLLGVHRALMDAEVGERTGIGAHNAAAREHAARAIELGYAGLITGHTHQPELTVVGDGFYANSGCGVEVLGPRPTHLGLPRPFVSALRVSRVELRAGTGLEVGLVVGDEPTPVATFLERVVIRPDHDTPTTPTVVASLPRGATWPVDRSTLGAFARIRRARRRAAGLLIGVATINIVSTLLDTADAAPSLIAIDTPDHLDHAGSVLTALMAVALIGFTRGVRRGYRQTWFASIVVLVVSATLLFVKVAEIEVGLVNLATVVYLLVERRHFRLLVTGRRRWTLWAVALAIAGLGLAVGSAVVVDQQEVVDRVAGVAVALVLGLVVLVALLVRRPGGHPMHTGAARQAAERAARDIIARLGGDSFDQSIVRDDKALLFTSGGVVSYKIIDEQMTVSPDPVCRVEERAELWASVMDYADTHGWRVGVLGASATWLPIYHASGLHDLYMGDEAIIDVGRFAAEPERVPAAADVGATAPTLGYRVEIVAPSSLDADTRRHLEALAEHAEVGAPGDGFVTSSGRLANDSDAAALLALCRTPDGAIVAFDQFLAAPAIGGYVLDLACATPVGDDADEVGHLLIAEALTWMHNHDVQALSLGLAASGGLVDPHPGRRLPVERRVLAELADLDELQRRRAIDGSFAPLWRPRYVVTDTMRGAWAGRGSP